MTYNTVATIARDFHLRERVAACASTEGEPSPVEWAEAHMWRLAGSPGWADAWEYAINTTPADAPPPNDVASIGRREGVVTDGMILAAVQPLRAVTP